MILRVIERRSCVAAGAAEGAMRVGKERKEGRQPAGGRGAAEGRDARGFAFALGFLLGFGIDDAWTGRSPGQFFPM